MRLTAVLIGATLMSGAAVAQPAPRPVAPPANLKDATVRAWLKAHVNPEGFTFALTDDAGAYYFRPALNQLPSPDRRRIWLRRENFSADSEGLRGDLALYEFDCAEQRRRLLAVDTYGGLNFGDPRQTGDFDTDKPDESPWAYPRPDSVGEALLVGACALTTGPWSKAKAP